MSNLGWSKLGRLALCGAVCLTLTLGLGCKREADDYEEDDSVTSTEADMSTEPMMDTGMTTDMSTDMSTDMGTDMSTETPPPQ